MKKQIPVWDRRMIEIMDAQPITRKEFFDSIDALPQLLSQVRSGKQSFRIKHIVSACRIYGYNPAWVLGFSDEVKLRKPKKAIKLLEDAVLAVKQEMRGL